MKSPNRLASAAIILASLLAADLSGASTTVSLYSGAPEGEHPAPVVVDKVSLNDRYVVKVRSASALVNYPDPERPVIVERVVSNETGGKVTCPWYWNMHWMFWHRINLAELGEYGKRVDAPATLTVNEKVFCDDGTCTDWDGKPLKPERLLHGKYKLRPYLTTDGQVFGLRAEYRPTPADYITISCQEFVVERIFTDTHYFDKLLVVDDFREEKLTDLDVDMRKIYLTFENSRGDRAHCAISNLFEVARSNAIRVADLRDCVLPTGNELTMYAQSRLIRKETRPCGKLVAMGVEQTDGKFLPDWKSGQYECDGKTDRAPIEKQYSYATRVEIEFLELRTLENQK
ncbi:MAG: hypothetical protein A2583_08940 [Bdellovibrionales bacterium RIFOXYD1_FULL_53_11]|nr:MAG: hypothetical protein A2583_08940 [Bdellovibrionales bacterium RIFOXYD1_FULL_53_11]